MKPKPNQERRAGPAFNSVDKATGYAVRFEKTRQGNWCSMVRSFCAISLAPSLRTVRRHTTEAIGYSLEGAIEDGWPIPTPEGKATPMEA
jgi:hypothetical protein